MASGVSNHLLAEQNKGNVDFSADTFKIRLMATGFTFDPDAHALWANVSASELANGNGYVTGGATLAGVTISEDDTNNRSDVAWNNAEWTASGGSIGPSPGAIVIDDTHANDAVVGFIDFAADQTATDGGTFRVTTPTFRSLNSL